MKLNSYAAVGEHATAKHFVNQSINKPTLERNIKTIEPNKQSFSKITQVTLNAEPTDDNHTAAKSFVDS